MNLKTLIIVGCLSFCFANGLFAQESEETRPQRERVEENFWDKIYVGGSFWMQFGNVTFIDVSPLVGYRFTDKFSAGPGIVYQYYNDNRYSPNYETNTYGFRFFARHTIFQQLFAQAQYESLSTEFLYIDGSKSREWVQGAFIGGGIAQPLGRKGAIILSGMYNLLFDEERSPYPNAWIFNIGFTL